METNMVNVISCVRQKVLFFYLLMFFSVCLSAQSYQVSTGTSLNVRSEPDTSGTVLGTLKNGDQLTVQSFQGDWAQITYKDQKAYISKKYIVPVVGPKSVTPKKDASVRLPVYSSKSLRETLPYAILFLSIGIWVLRLIMGKDTKSATITGFIALIFIGGMELWYFLVLEGDTWFCEPNIVGWVWTVINFFLYCGILIYQVILFFNIFSNMQEYSSKADFRITMWSYILAVVLAIVFYFADFDESAYFYLLIGLGVALFIQSIIAFRQISGFGYALATMMLVIVVPVATLLSFLHFISLLIMACLIGLVIAALGSGGRRLGTFTDSSGTVYDVYEK